MPLFFGGFFVFFISVFSRQPVVIPFFHWECFLPRFLMTFARRTHWFQDRNNKTQEEPGAQVNRLQVMCWLITKTTSIPLTSYDTSWTMSSNNRRQMLATEKCWNAVNSKLVQSTACRVKIPAPARIGCVRPGDVCHGTSLILKCPICKVEMIVIPDAWRCWGRKLGGGAVCGVPGPTPNSSPQLRRCQLSLFPNPAEWFQNNKAGHSPNEDFRTNPSLAPSS